MHDWGSNFKMHQDGAQLALTPAMHIRRNGVKGDLHMLWDARAGKRIDDVALGMGGSGGDHAGCPYLSGAPAGAPYISNRHFPILLGEEWRLRGE